MASVVGAFLCKNRPEFFLAALQEANVEVFPKASQDRKGNITRLAADHKRNQIVELILNNIKFVDTIQLTKI